MGYNLYTMAQKIAKKALKESDGDFDEARDFIHEFCDGHEVSIYYRKAILFCSLVDTSGGESFLEDCGVIAQEDDSFGKIACRIAYATLYVAACEALDEVERLHYEKRKVFGRSAL